MELFWIVDQQTRVKLMEFQWFHFKKKLDVPDEPKQAPINPELEPEVDQELVKMMEQPPSAEGRGSY